MTVVFHNSFTLECKAEVSPSVDVASRCHNSLGLEEFIGYRTTINEAKGQAQKKAIAYLKRMSVSESEEDPRSRFTRNNA